MKFEIHLTVDKFSQPLKDLVKKLGLKMLVIELDKGETKSQPMITTYGEGQLVNQFILIHYIKSQIDNLDVERTELDPLGFKSKVVRAKIETSFENGDYGKAKNSFNGLSVAYYEQHIKVRILNSNLEKELPLLSKYGHLSKNAHKVFNDGYQDRFITTRYNIGDEIKFDYIFYNIERNFDVKKREVEAVIYDSNLNLDKGWL